MKAKTEVFTVKQIAKSLKLPEPTINSLIVRCKLKPIMRLGNIRLFDEVAVERIRLELNLND